MAKKIFNVITWIFLILLIALVVMMFTARLSGRSPSVFGFHVFRVSSDSMEPTLVRGDVILVKESAADEIKNGDIITYKSREGLMAGEMITHRVVEEPDTTGGVYHYQTMGDAVGAPLDPVITYDQVEGRFLCKLPLIDKLYSFFFTPFGLIAFIVLILVLFGYEMISLILSYKTIDTKAEAYFKSVEQEAEPDGEPEPQDDTEQKE